MAGGQMGSLPLMGCLWHGSSVLVPCAALPCAPSRCHAMARSRQLLPGLGSNPCDVAKTWENFRCSSGAMQDACSCAVRVWIGADAHPVPRVGNTFCIGIRVTLPVPLPSGAAGAWRGPAATAARAARGGGTAMCDEGGRAWRLALVQHGHSLILTHTVSLFLHGPEPPRAPRTLRSQRCASSRTLTGSTLRWSSLTECPLYARLSFHDKKITHPFLSFFHGLYPNPSPRQQSARRWRRGPFGSFPALSAAVHQQPLHGPLHTVAALA
jgi:hypothetical protein